MKRAYVIVPTTVDSPNPPYKLNMTCGRAIGHGFHAGGLLQKNGYDAVENEAIALKVPNSLELERIKLLLAGAGIKFFDYIDVDKAFEGKLLTAVVTEPLNEEQAKILKPYKAWRCKCNEVENYVIGNTKVFA
jgi:hypothetical protein